MTDRLDEIEQAHNEFGMMISDPDIEWLIGEAKRLRELVGEVKSCGHDTNCPAGISDKYRCRCYYGIILEFERSTASPDSLAQPTASRDSDP